MTDEKMPMNPDEVSPELARKRELRRELGANRRARTDADRADVSARLLDQLKELPEFGEIMAMPAIGSIGAYVSYAGEPGTAHVREFTAANGIRLALPIIRPDFALDWAWDSEDVAPGRNYAGVPEPTGAVVAHGADGIVSLHCRVLLVPALAVDARGYRMGKGGGFYDRLLVGLEHLEARPLMVALVHDDEVLDELPVEEHDHPVDAVLTPSQIIRIPGRRGYIPFT